MNSKEKLTIQVEKIISKLESDYNSEINNGIYQLLYKRYKNALDILERNKDIREINIIGGVRGYMDSFNDYENPLLEELYKAEKILKELL
ncbi:hypothetical protein MOD68_05470 [Bacillus spizizenii]|nr:hypothetical protein [Bacillus spizizenii]